MSGFPLLVFLDGPSVLADLRRTLGDCPGWIAEPAEALERIHLDSFDWRLHERGEALEWERTADAGALLWSLPERSAARRLRLDAPPRFAADLPAGPLRDHLAAVLEMRALLPRATLGGRRWRLRQVDDQGKTVLRLELERFRVSVPGEAKRPAACALRVLPVRGFHRPLRELLAWLETAHGLRPTAALPVDRLPLPQQPGAYSAKLRLDLDPAAPAEAAVRALLLRLLEIMADNEAGIREDIDTEFLHDYRVAVRRTRTALAQLKSVFPSTPLARFQRGFAWLGAVTSPTRDLDVYLLGFGGYRDTLTPDLREHLGPLHAFLVRHQRLEQQRLARTLAGARYRTLVAAWRDLLTTPVAGRRPPPDAARPIGEVAGERIWAMFRRVLREGRAIDAESPAADLHELRKSCKKLRYLLEFFQSLYPPGAVRRLIRALKALQDHLGAFQDLEVQGHTLARFAGQMQEEGEVPERTLEAMAQLVETLHARQALCRESFVAHFTAFSAKPNRRLFRELFQPAPTAETP